MAGKLPVNENQPQEMAAALKKRPKTQHKRIYAKEKKAKKAVLDPNSVEACIKRVQ